MRPMTEFQSIESLPRLTREGVANLLYSLADDELILGHCDLTWSGDLPIDRASEILAAMALDELEHARLYYDFLHEMGEPEPAALIGGRGPRELRCASLVCLPVADWASGVLRQFLFDASEMVRLSALTMSSLLPLARAAVKTRSEEMRHMGHTRSWVIRLGGSGDDARRAMQSALDTLYPHALGVFEPTEYDETLALNGVIPTEEELQPQWESAVAPVLADAGLSVPGRIQPIYGGRVGRHPDELVGLLERVRQRLQAS
jgi:ring-1,2-phenylacetyl-CoA epoxidase subunit PaaC